MRKRKRKSGKIEGQSFSADIGDTVNDALVPVINVSLVLVVVFLSVSPMAMLTGIRALESHSSSGKGKTAAKENVEVVLAKDGVIAVNNIRVNMDGLASVLLVEIPKSKTGVVMLTADKENIVGDVVKILDTAKQNGAKKVIIMRKKEAS